VAAESKKKQEGNDAPWEESDNFLIFQETSRSKKIEPSRRVSAEGIRSASNKRVNRK
jgi:hypothetical protein